MELSMASSAEALQNLQNYQSSLQSPTQLLQGAQGSLGVQGAQQQVTGLRGAIANTTNLLKQVAPGVMGRTQNSLVTSAQANKQIQNEQAPISDTLSKQNSDYNNAYQDYSDLEKQAEQQAHLGMQGQQQQQSYLQSIYSALYNQEKDAADRAFQQQQAAESQRQFNAQLAASRSNAAAGANPGLDLGALLGGGGGGAAPKADRNTYNSSLSSLESALNAYRSAGYKGNVGSRDATKNALISQYSGIISPQEIKGYVDTLYNRYNVR